MKINLLTIESKPNRIVFWFLMINLWFEFFFKNQDQYKTIPVSFKMRKTISRYLSAFSCCLINHQVHF